MISIRTTLVAAGFVAMGLTSVAEHFARTAGADSEPVPTVGSQEVLPGKALRLTEKTPAAHKAPDLSPWI